MSSSAQFLLTHFDRLAEAPGGIAKLRALVLRLAVQGKLVPQNPSDEPAQKSVERVRVEKKASQSSRKDKLSENTDASTSELEFEIPNGWTVTSMADFALKITDGTHKTPNYVPKGVPFISVKDFSGGTLSFTNTRFISQEEHNTLYRRCDPKRGDIIFGRIGTLGKAVLVDTDQPFSLFVSVGLVRFSQKHANLDYFKLLLNSPFMTDQFEKIKVGGGSHTNKLNLGDLSSLTLLIPPLAEQRRIVSKVEELTALCDALEAAQRERETVRSRLRTSALHQLASRDSDSKATTFVLQNLPHVSAASEDFADIRQSIRQLAATGKLSAQSKTDEPVATLLARIHAEKTHLAKKPVTPAAIVRSEVQIEIPAEWEWIKLGDLCSKTGSGSTPRGGKTAYTTSGIPFLRSQNVYDDGLRLDGVAYITPEIHEQMSGTAVVPGDLLLNITGGSIGRCTVVPESFIEGNVSQHVAILRPAIAGMSDYLHLVVLSPHFQTIMLGSQTGAGREGLPKNRMDEIPIPLPPLAEQRRIVAKVEELMVVLDALEATLTTARTTAERLLAATIARLHGADDDEPATLAAAEDPASYRA